MKHLHQNLKVLLRFEGKDVVLEGHTYEGAVRRARRRGGGQDIIWCDGERVLVAVKDGAVSCHLVNHDSPPARIIPLDADAPSQKEVPHG